MFAVKPFVVFLNASLASLFLAVADIVEPTTTSLNSFATFCSIPLLIAALFISADALPIVCPFVALAIIAVAGFCNNLPVIFIGAPSK